MKKSLIALAALATVATAAQAQSSVTVYGIVDMGVVNSEGSASGRTTAAKSGTLSTSRLGFRGTEDLGGGLSASFNLESQLDASTGVSGGTTVAGVGTGATTTSSVFFHRAANVTLSSASLGSIQLGRMNKLEYDALIANDAFGAANFGGAVNVAYQGSGVYRDDARYSNAVVLRAPTLAGLKLAYQHQFGGQAGDSSAHSADSLSADYTFGKLRAIYTWAKNNTAAGAKYDEINTFGVNYDFGVAKAFVGHLERKIEGAAYKPKADYVGVLVPVNAKVNFMTQYTKISDRLGANKDSDVYAIGFTYAFSKRTTAYLLYGQANNDNGAATQVSTQGAAVGTNKDSQATAVGLRHTF